MEWIQCTYGSHECNKHRNPNEMLCTAVPVTIDDIFDIFYGTLDEPPKQAAYSVYSNSELRYYGAVYYYAASIYHIMSLTTHFQILVQLYRFRCKQALSIPYGGKPASVYIHPHELQKYLHHVFINWICEDNHLHIFLLKVLEIGRP